MEATIADREGNIIGASFEVKSLVEDFKMQAISGMMAAWELWEKAIVPSLLSRAGTWVGATAEKVERCDKLQDLESHAASAGILPTHCIAGRD